MQPHSHHQHRAPHTAPETATDAHDRARAAAVPAPGGQVVRHEIVAAETDWEFAPGRAARAWTFNGAIPGPILEARVGDVLEVALTNRLREPTTIHWHGLQLPAPMDGTEDVQRPIAPGETFTYRYVLPDAGTFWYHPHVNETEQLERGLYGALIVRADGEPVLDAERVLVLDDVKLDRTGQIAKLGGFVEHHDGRQGNVLLVNGRWEPELSIAAGHVERWRIVNASSARYVRLALRGHAFALLGTDGGLIERPVSMTEVLLTPGDRVDIAVGPFTEGESIAVETLPYDRRTFARSRTARFATLRVGPPQPSRAVIPPTLRKIDALAGADAPVTRTVRLGVRPSLKTGVKFVINGEAHHHAQPVRRGELQVWDVVNDTLMDHPFHLHGYFFQVLSVNGKQPPFRSWEDTVNIPPRSRVRIAWMPDRAGEWMYHCHILEHHASGMMAHFEVVG